MLLQSDADAVRREVCWHRRSGSDMNGQMAGGHLMIIVIKVINVILSDGVLLAVLHQKIKLELLRVCIVVVAVVCLSTGRVNEQRKMAGGGIVDIIIADVPNTEIIIFWRTAEAVAAVGHRSAKALLEGRGGSGVHLRTRDPSHRDLEFRTMLRVLLGGGPRRPATGEKGGAQDHHRDQEAERCRERNAVGPEVSHLERAPLLLGDLDVPRRQSLPQHHGFTFGAFTFALLSVYWGRGSTRCNPYRRQFRLVCRRILWPSARLPWPWRRRESC